MFRIISLLYILSLVNAYDPWDRSFAKKDILDDEKQTGNNHKTFPTTYKEPAIPQCVGDNFYKKLLGIIVSRGQFKEGRDGMIEGSLHFEFPPSKFGLLKEILSKTEQFTPDDYRTIDGLMSDYLLKLSFVRQLAESWTFIILTWWERYLIHIIICFGTLGCIYGIYKTNWARVSVRYLIMTIIFFICYAWEFMVAKQEADLKDYQEFVRQQQCSWLYFWDCSSTEIVRQVSHYWYLLHPVKILGNLFTRMVMNNIQLVYLQINEMLEHISKKAPLGTQGFVHIGLSIFTLVLIIFIAIALICNVILNRPFSLRFMFLNFDLKQKANNSYNSNKVNVNDSRQPIGDSLSGGNLNILMSALGKKLSKTTGSELPTDHNSGQLRIRYNPKKHKSHNIAAKSLKTNPVRSGKSSPKESRGHKINEGGDHLE